MSSRRTQKAAEAIREVVSMAILTEIKDPRVRDVTVTYVEVSPDMRQAKIHVSVMGDETKQQLSLRGLQNSAGFLQSKVAKRIDTRYTPRLAFVLDLGVKKSIEISQILQSVLPTDPAVSDPTSTAPVDDAEFDEDEFDGKADALSEDETTDEETTDGERTDDERTGNDA
jgi:ribosome-binding factor A